MNTRAATVTRGEIVSMYAGLNAMGSEGIRISADQRYQSTQYTLSNIIGVTRGCGGPISRKEHYHVPSNT